jgi:magnesium-transporting ATPase (P-type)
MHLVAKNVQTYGSNEFDIPIGDRLNLCYASTVVTKGRGTGIVVGTAMNTQIGIIAAAISGQKKNGAGDQEQTHFFHRALEKVKTIMYVCLPFAFRCSGISNQIFCTGLRSGTPLQIKLAKLAYLLFLFACVLILIVFAVARFKM